MSGQILIFVEHNGKEISNITPQLVTRGRALADRSNSQLNALVLGHNVGDVVQTVSEMDLDSILLVDDGALDVYNPELYTQVLPKIFKQVSPKIVLFGDTHVSREIAPAVATRMAIPFLSCCASIELSETKIAVAQPKYEGTTYAVSEIEPLPQSVLISVQSSPDLAPTARRRTPSLAPLNVGVDLQGLRTTVIEITKGEPSEFDITKANILVSGGRGLGVKENIALIRQLAQVLGGGISCSRPLTDLGWLSLDYLVGMSGKTVTPNVYLACGISGAPQHLMAMSGAKCIIAINKDANAPIFRVAHYAVIGDLRELLPALIAEACKAKAET
jgi:electron transfer flavoprotein alpha subunit